MQSEKKQWVRPEVVALSLVQARSKLFAALQLLEGDSQFAGECEALRSAIAEINSERGSRELSRRMLLAEICAVRRMSACHRKWALLGCATSQWRHSVCVAMLLLCAFSRYWAVQRIHGRRTWSKNATWFRTMTPAATSR